MRTEALWACSQIFKTDAVLACFFPYVEAADGVDDSALYVQREADYHPCYTLTSSQEPGSEERRRSVP